MKGKVKLITTTYDGMRGQYKHIDIEIDGKKYYVRVTPYGTKQFKVQGKTKVIRVSHNGKIAKKVWSEIEKYSI